MANDWLFMLYLSGDNNLSAEMIWALSEIQDQPLPDGFKMTILYDPLSLCCPSYVFNLKAKSTNGPEGARVIDRKRVPPLPLLTWMKDDSWMKGDARKTDYTTVFQWLEDSSDSDTLRKFVEWSVAEQPSTHRMLILSGHGSGAVGDFLPDNNGKNGQPGSLTIPALQLALDTAQSNMRHRLEPDRKLIDILGMDSCLMSMAEVGYQVRKSVEYLVGSEGFVQETGWPYGFFLKRLRERIAEPQSAVVHAVDSKGGGVGLDDDVGHEAILPERLAAYIVEDYIAYYRTYLPADVSVDMAACQLATLGQPNDGYDSPSLRSTVQKLATILTDGFSERDVLKADEVQDLVILAHWRAQSYKFEQYTDLWDFCDQLRKLSDCRGLTNISEACRRVQEAINNSVGRTNGNDGRQNYQGIEFQHSHGLSVFFPWSSKALTETDKTAYKLLDFGCDTGWGSFLDKYLEKTMREVRKVEGLLSTELQLFGPGSEDAEEKAEHGRTLQGRNAPNSGRNAPNSGRNAPNSGRNAPNSGRNAPNSGRMLQLFLASQNSSMKNPPQSVYLRPDPEYIAT